MRIYINPLILFQTTPKRCIRRIIRDCRECPLSPSGCRFGRSGSNGFVDGGAVSLTGFEDEGRLAVEADVKKLFKFF